MKHILCYGDSNTHGYDPVKQGRYDYNERWPGIMQNLLGADYRVIEEGLSGRTTVFDDPYGILNNGKTYLTPCIRSHYPLDLVIIMLGTNDMKERYNLPACDIAKGAGIIAKMILDITAEKSSTNIPSKVLLVSPIYIGKTITESKCGEEFGYMRAYELSRKLAPKFQKVAQSLGIEFMDAALIIEPSEIDAVHLSIDGQRALGEAIAKRCIEILD